MQICVARFFALHFEVTEIERGKEAELYQQERERRQERKQAQLWRSQYRQCLQIEVSLLFVLICCFFKKHAKSNLKVYQMITNSNLWFQAHLQRIGEDGLMVFDCFSTARSFLRFHPVFACLCLLKSLKLWILWYPVHRRGSLPFSQDMKRRAILRDRKRIEGKVNEAPAVSRGNKPSISHIKSLFSPQLCLLPFFLLQPKAQG